MAGRMHEYGYRHDQYGQGGEYIQQGRPGRAQEPLPHGEVVSLFSEANRNYLLTSREDGVVLAFKNHQDPKQYWIKVDMGDKFVDEEGSHAFLLVNKATGHALSHGTDEGAAVNQEPYRAHVINNSVLWSQGRDEGKGYKSVRTVTNINLNLDADHGDKKHGGIRDGHRLVVHSWKKQDNQRWMISSIDPED